MKTIVITLLLALISTPSFATGLFHHKKPKHIPPPLGAMDFDTPLVDPGAASIYDPSHAYLGKKLTELEADLAAYPILHDQITALIDEVKELQSTPTMAPGYVEKFNAMHTTLIMLWKLEEYCFV